MTDDPQLPTTQQEASPTPTPPNLISPLAKKSNKNVWIIAAAVAGLLCLCSIICVVVFGLGSLKVYKEKPSVESIMDSYMKAMANKDAIGAYALFSPRAQRQIPLTKHKEMLEGNNIIIFEGYQSLSISNLNISAVAATNPDQPQGTVATVSGVIQYEGGIQGSFNGTLEKVGDKWMIDGVHITVPPSKMK